MQRNQTGRGDAVGAGPWRVESPAQGWQTGGPGARWGECTRRTLHAELWAQAAQATLAVRGAASGAWAGRGHAGAGCAGAKAADAGGCGATSVLPRRRLSPSATCACGWWAPAARPCGGRPAAATLLVRRCGPCYRVCGWNLPVRRPARRTARHQGGAACGRLPRQGRPRAGRTAQATIRRARARARAQSRQTASLSGSPGRPRRGASASPGTGTPRGRRAGACVGVGVG